MSRRCSTGLRWFRPDTGLKTDPVAALAWYKLAADTDPLYTRRSCLHAAILLITGNGVKEDPAMAYQHFVKAAKANHIDAQYNAGVMKYQAIGIPKTRLREPCICFAARVGYPPAISARELAAGEAGAARRSLRKKPM